MKIALSLGLTFVVVVLLLIKSLKKYRGKIVFFYGCAVAALFAFYNIRTADLILPFYHPTNQMFYQPEFFEEGLYPDSLLPYLLKGKTIHISDYGVDLDGDLNSFYAWVEGRFMMKDMINIFEEFGADVEISTEDENNVLAERLSLDKSQALCADFGGMNDTFRYAFFHNDLETEFGNGFYYYWFYSSSMKPFNLLIDPEGIEEAADLYVLKDDNDNMVIVSEDVFYREVAEND